MKRDDADQADGDQGARERGPAFAAIAKAIALEGPLRLDRFMEMALHDAQGGYYRHADPIGASGDFVTSPEISQIFGEILGLSLLSAWREDGAGGSLAYLELGVGRGALLRDALRSFGVYPPAFEGLSIHLLETHPGHRDMARRAVADVSGAATLSPVFMIACRDACRGVRRDARESARRTAETARGGARGTGGSPAKASGVGRSRDTPLACRSRQRVLRLCACSPASPSGAWRRSARRGKRRVVFLPIRTLGRTPRSLDGRRPCAGLDRSACGGGPGAPDACGHAPADA